ncbi:PREDICTED: nuclear pore complex protein NUP85 isoform X2 [Tarenaya hassleriana]|uniref:nuclear pore complex protein NUP85 isoform X2 n=1 Tax=Tarenaya hassleriana TaxID=28532 RepID=UPI00053C830B|nr:PREDICTED: nuclear pore complex protein NUP85 isoform X2 [Tarenaya hassleriana]
MPGMSPESGTGVSSVGGDLVPFAAETQAPAVYPLCHGLKSPVHRLSISWGCGNNLRVTVLRRPKSCDEDGEAGGEVLNVRLGGGDDEIGEAQWRRIAYGSVSPFALLQSRKNAFSSLSKMNISPSQYQNGWWEYVMEYSKDIKSLLCSSKSSGAPLIEDPKAVVKTAEQPTSLKAAWELMEIFYADKPSLSWLPEQLVDWLADYDILFSSSHPTIYSKLVDFQNELVGLQVVEDDPRYWEVMSSALSVGWLEIVVKLLHLHGSYQLDQLGNREVENGLVEAIAVLISKMPRMRPQQEAGKFGECFPAKPDFMKTREKWHAQITKLECSAFWVQCAHHQTREGLRNMLKVMMGNTDCLSAATSNWMELFVSHFLYVRPFTTGLDSMHSLAQKCIQLKPFNGSHKLMRLLIGILGENAEVVLAECSKGFGSWMVAHAMELLTAGNDEGEIFLHEEQRNLGGITIEELNRLVYAQVLSSHALTWQIAPVYLASCEKQGLGLLEMLFYRQHVQLDQLLIKSLEICRLYELNNVGAKLMKIAGVHHWKHGKKGSGIFWLQQAGDEHRLNRISQQLFDSVGKSLSDESLEQWEGLVELLGSESQIAGGLDFLHKYRDFKRSLRLVQDEKNTNAAREAVELLVSLMKNPTTPPHFWLPLLHDSLKLLNWSDCPLLNVSQTNLLLNKLQELSMVRLRPGGGFTEPDLPPQAVGSVRLALATNLGRAILDEC